MRLTFECDGQTLIDRELLRVGAYASDASPAFHAIADMMRDETREQFSTQGAHASGGWRPLKPATVRAKQRAGMRPQILQRTGSLLDSLTVEDDGNQVLQVRPDSLTFGSKLPYSGYHQRGTRHMPRRAPLAFTEPAKRAMVKVLQRYILTGEVLP